MAKYNSNEFEGTFWTALDGDFYVSTVGSDTSGDGHPQRPFLTVNRAMKEAASSDKIIIGPSEYVSFTGEPSGSIPPCKVASSGNVDLTQSGTVLNPLLSVEKGDRILIWQQTNPIENGIYIAESSTWNRDKSFSICDDSMTGMMIPVLEGTYAGDIFQFVTSGEIQENVTPLEFQRISSENVNWGNIEGDITTQTDLNGILNSKANSTDVMSAINGLLDSVPTEGDTLNKLYNLIQNVVGVSASATDIADRDAQQSNLVDQQNIYVTDASADTTVTSGWAIYKYIQATDSFIKIMEQENIDATILTQGNGITISDNKINVGGNYISDIVFAADEELRFRVVTSGQVGIIGNETQIRGYEELTLRSKDIIIKSENSGQIKFLNEGDGTVFIDSSGTGGIIYGDDYSSEFIERSLVDKAYVDSQISSIGSIEHVTKVGTPQNNQVAVWTGDGTVEGTTNFTCDSGNLTVSGTITSANFQLSSDVRGKNVLSSLGGNDIEYIKFKAKGSDEMRYGVSAQQVQKVLPEVVSEGSDGQLKVAYIDLLIHQLAKLEEEVKQLKAEKNANS